MSGIEQPENETRLRAMLNALPLRSTVLNNQYYGMPVDPDIVEGSMRAQDVIPVKNAYRGEYAIECDDGSFIGAARVNPANLSTSDDDVWAQKVNRLSSIITSVVDFDAEMVEVMRAVDFRERVETFSDRASNLRQQVVEIDTEAGDDNDDNNTPKTALAKGTLADIATERRETVKNYNESSLVREHYMVVKAEPSEAAKTTNSDRGGIENLPVLGEIATERRVQNQREGEEHTTIMLDLIRQRLDSVVNKLNMIDGLSASQLSSVAYAQVIGDYYQTANIYANAEFNSLIREAPVPGEYSDPEYDISHDVNAREANSRWANASVSVDGGSTAIGNESTINPQTNRVKQLLNESPVPILDEHERGERFKSLLTPDRIDPTPDPGHITINPTGDAVHSTTLWVAEWPDRPKDGMLKEVLAYNKRGVDVTLATHLTGLDKEEAKDDLQNKSKSLKAKWDTAKRKGHVTADRKRRHYEKTEEVMDSLEGTQHGLFEVGCYITVRSSDLDKLDTAVSAIKTRISEAPSHARGIRADYNHLDGFRSTAPVAEDHLDRRVRMRGDGLAAIFPYSSNNLSEPGGIEIGSHAKRQEPTILNIFDDKHRSTGYDFGIIGKKGAGKTISMGEIIERQKVKFPETDVVVIDPLQEYAGLCELFDGERVVVGGNTAINPFHIEKTPPEKLARVGRNTPYKDAIRRDMDFVESYYTLEGFQDFSEKRGTWERAIKIAHERKGIVMNPATHDNESPTMTDVRQVMVDMANTAKEYVDEDLEDVEDAVDDRRKTAIKILNNDLEPFTEDGKYAHLTRQTDLDMGDTGFLYLDLQQYENEQDSGGLMMELLVSQVYEQAKVHDHPSMLAIDESHYMLRRSASMEALKQASRHGRHYDLSLGFGTHSLKEFFDESGDGNETQLTDNAEIIINNMAFMLFLYNDEMNEDWAGELGLSKREMEYIQEAKPGNEERGYSEALLKVDEKGCYPLHIEMSMDEDENPREFALLRYDQSNHPNDLYKFLERYDDTCNWSWTGDNIKSPDETSSGGVGVESEHAVQDTTRSEESQAVTSLKIVSKNEAAAMHRVGIDTVGDLLESDIPSLMSVRGVSEERGEQLKQNAEEFVTTAADSDTDDTGAVDDIVTVNASDNDNDTGADTDGEDDESADNPSENAFAEVGSTGVPLEDLQGDSDNSHSEGAEPGDTPDESSDEVGAESQTNGTPTLTDIQQVAEDRADILREHGYATVKDVAAGEDGLREIDGIAKARAEEIAESAKDLANEQTEEAVVADGGDQ